jgi:hypothetical protein
MREESMTWHVHPEVLAEYGQGRLDTARVLAVEAHVIQCGSCRARVPADTQWLVDSWSSVLDVVDAPRRSPVEWALGRVGLPEHRARLVAATPGLRRSWLVATTAVLALAVWAAYLGQEQSRVTLVAFLIAAPVLPVLAVATAYGAPVDPLDEIASTTPLAGPSLVLWRAATVVGVSMVMGVVAAALLPGPAWYAVAWLLPAFLLCVGALALSTVLSLQLAAALLGGGWLVVVTTLARTEAPRGFALDPAAQQYLFGPVAQTGYLIAALGAAAILTVRRRRLDPGEPR